MKIYINQMGYHPDSVKTAVLTQDAGAGASPQAPDIVQICSVTGTCGNCKNETCICNQIVITRHCRPAGRIKFILVGEALGF